MAKNTEAELGGIRRKTRFLDKLGIGVVNE